MMLPKPSNEISFDLSDKTERERPLFVDISVDKNNNPRIGNTDDNLNALATYLGIGFRFNMLSFKSELYEVCGNTIDIDEDQIRSKLITAANRSGLPKIAIDDHLTALCLGNKYHPIKNWLESDKWDGIERISPVVNCLNAKHKDVADSVIKRWLIGTVASLFEPTFKSKLVPILQGGQSFKKTAFVERIAKVNSTAFLEGAELNPDNKDSVLSCINHWIVELGELERTNKNSQGSLKAFITKSEDKLRKPYGRSDITKPRQTHFIATVNGNDFLKDETGSSRFAVIEMQSTCDMDTLNTLLGWCYDGTGSIKQTNPARLKQFWLEVKHLYDNGQGWQLTENEALRLSAINSAFNDNGSWYDYILGSYVSSPSRFSVIDWFTSGDFVKTEDKISVRETKLIGKALSKLASEGHIEKKKGNGNKTLYRFKPKKEVNPYASK